MDQVSQCGDAVGAWAAVLEEVEQVDTEQGGRTDKGVKDGLWTDAGGATGTEADITIATRRRAANSAGLLWRGRYGFSNTRSRDWRLAFVLAMRASSSAYSVWRRKSVSKSVAAAIAAVGAR
jgi:hypothetical protein